MAVLSWNDGCGAEHRRAAILPPARPKGQASPPHEPPATAAAPASAGYGHRRGPNYTALAVTALLHVLVIGGLLTVRQHASRDQDENLVSINLSPPPPPPSEPQPQPRTVPETAPPPMLVLKTHDPVIVPPTPDVPVAPPVSEMATPQVAPAPLSSPAPAVPAPPSTVQAADLGTQMISGKPPRYPLESRRSKEQGTVTLALVLGVDGCVERISISRSSGSERLDHAALNAVRKWRWEPTVRLGQPVRVTGLVEIPFILQA